MVPCYLPIYNPILPVLRAPKSTVNTFLAMTNMVCHLFTSYHRHGTGGTVKLYFSTSLFVVNSMKDLSNLYNAVSTGLWYNK